MSFPPHTVVVLLGPTGSGKTAVSLPLARLLNAEIISADSRQVYRSLDIGTAKPSPNQRAVCPHHFIDIVDPTQEFNAGEYGVQGREVIHEIFGSGKCPLVVGGSGLYIRSLIDGFFDGPAADPEYRDTLEERLREEGIAPLVEMLRTVDPDSAARIDPTKPRRVIRALEVHHMTGVPLSELHRRKRPEITFSVRMFGLRWDRAELYRRIEDRVDGMIAEGLLEEVDSLLVRGYDPHLNSLNTVGYAEAFAHRRGELTFDEMVRLIKQSTRRYAKRQMTWFRRDARIEWIDMNGSRSPEDVAEEIAGRLFERTGTLTP
jgi:tRNA dimethylallyltransferase